MTQISEYVNVDQKIQDVIADIEQKTNKKFTKREVSIAYRMFLSGFLFSQQWNGNEET